MQIEDSGFGAAHRGLYDARPAASRTERAVRGANAAACDPSLGK
jgi:hypothetical protein